MTRRGLHAVAATLAMLGLFAAGGCGEVARTGRSPVILVVEGIEYARGNSSAQAQFFGGTLPSDVMTAGVAYQDQAKGIFRLTMKDPGTASSPTSPGALNEVTLTRYHVQYVRADGRNTQGVDVPYAFDGALTSTVPRQGTSEGIFDIVRIQAKLEPPLRNLVGGGAGVAISTLAQITFYGRDQAGNDVQATGTLSVAFADWGDPKDAEPSNPAK